MEYTIGSSRTRSIEVFEENLEEEKDLNFKEEDGFKFNEDKSLEEFIYNLLKTYSSKYDTYTVEKFKKNKKIQCGKSSERRSIGDIYRICRYYYGCSLEDIMKILGKLMKDSKVRTSICHEADRRMYYCCSVKENIICDPEEKDEFNRLPEDYIKMYEEGIK